MTGNTMPSSEYYDLIVVGGGSAGCAFAARMSEMPGFNVLLIEAGRDITLDNVDPEIVSNYPGKAYFDPRNTWQGQKVYLGNATVNDPSARRTARYEQARILGGGSSINGMCANRGSPEDYDGWVQMGAEGWSWQDVKSYFRKLETDLDFSGEYHGNDGPVSIRRFPREDWSGFMNAVADSLTDRGLSLLPDQNGPWEDGFMQVSASVDREGRRASCAFAYLTPEVRARPNLEIATGISVRRILFDGTRTTGVEIVSPSGERSEIKAGQTVVCAGAINSPALLLRSGVGPKNELAQYGIESVADRPGVGKNLIEHPAISVSCYLRSAGRQWKEDRHHTQMHVRYSSGVENCPKGDMTIAMLARSGWHAMGARIASFYLFIGKPYSAGSLTLDPNNIWAPPIVDFRMLSDWRDRKRLVEGFRFIAQIALDPKLNGVRSKSFPTNYSDRVRKVSSPGLRNAVVMRTFAAILDWIPPLRGFLIDKLVSEGLTLERLLRDEKALEEFVDGCVAGVWHPSGSCRMGPSGDPMAVTDSTGRVYGVTGLRVCDASLMPSIPCANTNIPTIMIAEKIADHVKDEVKKKRERSAA